MTRAASAWFELHRAAKRAEIAACDAFGRSLCPEIHRPEIAARCKRNWLVAEETEAMIHATAARISPQNVVVLAGARTKRAQERKRGAGGRG